MNTTHPVYLKYDHWIKVENADLFRVSVSQHEVGCFNVCVDVLVLVDVLQNVQLRNKTRKGELAAGGLCCLSNHPASDLTRVWPSSSTVGFFIRPPLCSKTFCRSLPRRSMAMKRYLNGRRSDIKSFCPDSPTATLLDQRKDAVLFFTQYCHQPRRVARRRRDVSPT